MRCVVGPDTVSEDWSPHSLDILHKVSETRHAKMHARNVLIQFIFLNNVAKQC
jgi:hypothetical protein